MDSWDLGDEGERLAYDILRTNGWAVMQSSLATNGGAAMMHGPTNEYILPDLLAFQNGNAVWFEVKTKSDGPIKYRKRDEYRHGFERRQYHEYQSIAEVTEMPVCIVVYEVPNETVLIAPLSELSVVDETTKTQARSDYNGEKIVFFRREAFPVTISATRSNGETHINGRHVRSSQSVNLLSDVPLFPGGPNDDTLADGQSGIRDFGDGGGGD